MSNQELDFDWGKARDCNIDIVFQTLRYDAEKAIAARNEGFGSGDHPFTIASHVQGDRFDVVRDREIIVRRGFEQHRETEITTYLIFRKVLPDSVAVYSSSGNEEKQLLKEAKVILDSAGQCRLKVADGRELEPSQFVKQALEAHLR